MKEKLDQMTKAFKKKTVHGTNFLHIRLDY